MITDPKAINKLNKEHKDLHTKINNLVTFITTDDYYFLTWKEKYYINLQLIVMKIYCKVLTKRIDLNNDLISDVED